VSAITTTGMSTIVANFNSETAIEISDSAIVIAESNGNYTLSAQLGSIRILDSGTMRNGRGK
jgi:hypothetical protein